MKRAALSALLIAVLLAASAAYAEPPCIALEGPSYASASIDVDEDGAPEYILELNHWNLKSAKGVSRITYCPANQTLHYTQDLYSMEPRRSTVYGYPEIYYGYKPWNSLQASDGEVRLPLPLPQAKPLWVAVNYTISHQPRLPINLALDLWLTREKNPRKVGGGDAEVMVWLYHSSLRPAGAPVARLKCPAYLDGKPYTASFTLWEARFNWLYLAYVLDTPLPRGAVAVDMACILSHAAARHPWIEKLYLEDVELGTEYGLPGVQRASFHWSLYRFTVTRHNPEEPLAVTLEAVDTRGNPLPGVEFTVNERPAGETGGDGKLVLHLKPGDYVVSAPSRHTWNGTVYVFKGWSSGGSNHYTLLIAGLDGSLTAIYTLEGAANKRGGEKPAPPVTGGTPKKGGESKPSAAKQKRGVESVNASRSGEAEGGPGGGPEVLLLAAAVAAAAVAVYVWRRRK